MSAFAGPVTAPGHADDVGVRWRATIVGLLDNTNALARLIGSTNRANFDGLTAGWPAGRTEIRVRDLRLVHGSGDVVLVTGDAAAAYDLSDAAEDGWRLAFSTGVDLAFDSDREGGTLQEPEATPYRLPATQTQRDAIRDAALADGGVTVAIYDPAVVHDAAVADIAAGPLSLAAAAEIVPAPSYDGILAGAGDQVLSGAAAAAQRLADALRIERGTYPLQRDYGSTVGRVLDRRPAAIFAAVAETLAHPANGLDDIELQVVRASAAGAVVTVEVDALWRSAPAASPTPISIREQLVAP